MRFNKKGFKKMKNIIIILSIFLSNSCSSEMIENNFKQTVDYEFESYLKDYKTIINSKDNSKEKLYDSRIDRLSVNFADLDKNVLGECTWQFDGSYKIEISKSYWKTSTFIGKQFLIYHELEHCVRFRPHSHLKKKKEDIWDYIEALGQFLGIIEKKGFFKDGCPDSIMYPYDTSELCNINHYNEYIEEMANYQS
jgi:hypothetical protein